jgi:hypothetical protein
MSARLQTDPVPTYDHDFHAWALYQAELLRKIPLPRGLDVENLAEEIEDLARRQRDQLYSRIKILLAHLLKCRLMDPPTRSWSATIKEQRRRIEKLLKENPSLNQYVEDAIREEYDLARLQAAVECDVPEEHFPAECPWEKKDEVLKG